MFIPLKKKKKWNRFIKSYFISFDFVQSSGENIILCYTVFISNTFLRKQSFIKHKIFSISKKRKSYKS